MQRAPQDKAHQGKEKAQEGANRIQSKASDWSDRAQVRSKTTSTALFNAVTSPT